ncbi:DUF4097 family beta strand repeat protein [Aquibacillus halophilus]|uniref:DUF4097 family beta strand repeat protein n=1 Tax=Aquibacillus halophilus TaxID=930132 RepID=A0A6A8DE00_9BACI|nr:DUF4097 domain-containing protein [Aquibacillus halophilus]MRH42001.1 DUF4097 family beta strand repeat protein [Aquibacillus halophilus]
MKEEQVKILKMVEDGIVSAEEAVELIESLEKAEQAKNQTQFVSKNVDWEKREEQTNDKQHTSKKSKFVHFMEEAFTKIKNVDLDFNFGPHYTVSHIFHNQSASFSDMDIDISNGTLTIFPWNESDVRIECEARVYQSDDQDKARKKFIEEAEFLIVDDHLRFLIPSKNIKADVTIKIPNRIYNKIAIKLFNGSINAENLSVGQFKAKSTNGTVTIDHIDGNEADLETANGSIKVEQSSFETLETETINGSTRIDGQYGKVDSQAVSGSIHCDWHGERAHTGFFKTTTGSVRLRLPNSVRIDGQLETNIGNIHCDIDNYKIVEQKKEMMKRSLHFDAYSHHEKLFHLEAETKTGSVWIIPSE